VRFSSVFGDSFGELIILFFKGFDKFFIDVSESFDFLFFVRIVKSIDYGF